jgi:branched-chain amino acid aminotransferase
MSDAKPTSDTRFGAISVNGRISSVDDARISAMDHGFLFGDSVYEVVRTIDGRPVAVQEHLDRLRASAAQIYFEIPWTDEALRSAIRETVEATELDECYMRLVITRGPGPMSLLPDGCHTPTRVIYVMPLNTPRPEALAEGIAVTIPERLRNDPGALAPSAKTGNYLNNLLALVEARRDGGADAVLVGAGGHVTEATTANVFWVKDGDVFTPSLASGILPGITRSMLLPALARAGFPVQEGRFPLARLLEADEVFLTGSVKGVMPVVRIGDKAIGDGKPGPITLRFVALHDDVLRSVATDW